MRIVSHVRRVQGRRRLVGAAVALVALVATACGAGGSGAGGSEAGLRVLVEAGGHAELQPVADAYEKETGTKVTFVELPYDGLYDRLSSELSSGSVSFDVAALDAIWLKSFAAAVKPLDGLFTDEVKADLFPALLTEAKVDGAYVGMPVWTNAEILYYRKDLFDDPANKSAFKARFGYDLVPPKTWQQFSDAAQFFTGKGRYGTDVKGAVETEYLATLLQAGATDMVLTGDGKVDLDNPAALTALDFYAGLNTKLKVSPPGAAQVDWAAAQNLYNQGKTAMLRFWAHAYTQIPADSPAKGKTGVTVLPAGPAGTAAVPGAWYLSVPKATGNAEGAEKFIEFAYQHNDLGVQTTLGLAARKSALQKYEKQPGHENLTALIAALDAPATAPRPANAKWQQIVDTVLIPMLQKAVVPGADNAALLKEAQAKTESLLK
ncbi:ABC-type glycerol-3-phosphate transport system substrate-binding protein [Kribbella sp. VKM Ac-2527]|uniref:ABC-type glycerol-3-phosphate transport system substrate-binding protein n=1 Tax=Kribbella caucasensis TaxID=2512215 RepID=A0A4R6K8X4_9ACTN|nr:sugar ABC transporter substrate-binding protein [Kribbella sp. VKM Ac-2527]TDO46242.1 ABC-type glycerol-3-phosphate transport system substrate-binding protein [Kribbella sp. VKM Ac-2527]